MFLNFSVLHYETRVYSLFYILRIQLFNTLENYKKTSTNTSKHHMYFLVFIRDQLSFATKYGREMEKCGLNVL